MQVELYCSNCGCCFAAEPISHNRGSASRVMSTQRKNLSRAQLPMCAAVVCPQLVMNAYGATLRSA